MTAEAIYRVVRPDSALCWLRDRAFGVLDDSGRVSRIVGFAEDISERVLADQTLHDSAQKRRAGGNHGIAATLPGLLRPALNHRLARLRSAVDSKD